jgi:predicted heme/steroid binding protein
MRAAEYNSVPQSETLHHQNNETKEVKVSPRRYKQCFLMSVVLNIVLLTALVAVYNMPWYKRSQEDPGSSSSDGANQTLVLSKSGEEEPTSAFPPAGGDTVVSVPMKNITVDEYNCQGERYANETPLRTGQFLCSNNKQFVFGMTEEGSLIKRSTTSDATHKKNDKFYEGRSGDYFVLHRDGKIAVYDINDKLQWQRESHATIHWTSKCLKEYDCPYLHLHDDGVLVLNWIANGRWNAKGIKEEYDF